MDNIFYVSYTLDVRDEYQNATEKHVFDDLLYICFLFKFDNEIDGSINIFPVTEPESSHLLHHLLSAAQRALRVEHTPIMLSN